MWCNWKHFKWNVSSNDMFLNFSWRIVHILSQHIAIDIDNSLVFSKYHARNAMGEVLTEDIDISAFLQKNIFPQVNDWELSFSMNKFCRYCWKFDSKSLKVCLLNIHTFHMNHHVISKKFICNMYVENRPIFQ